jgi:hypothetical protein
MFIRYSLRLNSRVNLRLRFPGDRPRYLLLSKSLISVGGVDWTWAEQPNACEDEDFTSLRGVALSSFHIQHTPVKQQKTPVVTILSKEIAVERRGIVNEDALVEGLRQKFPEASVEIHAMRHMTKDAQLEVLARTTILVSNIGSASFRLLFLPDNAQARV